MSRPLRIEYAGAWHYVMSRGAARQAIYLQPSHRQLFLALLGELLERFGIETHAYCLMDNHYHLLLHTPKGQLSRGMRQLNGLYTRNDKIARNCARAPGFEGATKPSWWRRPPICYNVSRDIYRNPLEAGWTETLEHYKWSSYPAYVQCVGPEPWLQHNHILTMAGGAPMQYHAFVGRTGDREVNAFYVRRRLKPILGGETFMAQVTQDLYHTHVSSDPLSNSAASAPQ